MVFEVGWKMLKLVDYMFDDYFYRDKVIINITSYLDNYYLFLIFICDVRTTLKTLNAQNDPLASSTLITV